MPDQALYLASRSPRRQELLRQLNVDFEILKLREASGRQRDVLEVAHDGEPALHYVERIARTMAAVGAQQMLRRGLPPRPVLGADTEVVLDGTIFGKPRDAIDATRMLTLLSGRTHHVSTAVAVAAGDEVHAEIATTAVTFCELTLEEISRYVATGESADKAGAYAIQGRAAGFVSRLEGSYSGVMGLPLFETSFLLARIGVRVL
jgi:septum formation protein